MRITGLAYDKLIAALVLLAFLMFFSSKAGGNLLIASIEHAAIARSSPAMGTAQAIVVLTGGDMRIRKAAGLHRETGLPVLASGGDGEAAAIKRQLQDDFHIAVRWTEGNSLNTEQNALFSAQILAKENIQSILLVTHAMHMPRAKMMFSDRGLKVIPAPSDFSSHAPLEWRDFQPGTEGRKLTQSALHELVGLVWYRIRYFITTIE